MDPLTLLRELFGEEPIRKVVSSGFDSVHKIAATTPESLSFFSGINEAVARQIVASAEESLSGPPASSYRESRAGSAEPEPPQEAAVPVKPRTPPTHRASAQRKEKPAFDPMDEKPLLDAGGILKTVAQEPRPKDFMEHDDILDEVGLTDAEADFLEGISPWSGGTPKRERTFPAPLEARASSHGATGDREEREVEYAPISDWSPEKDPDPVPRLVRAHELGGLSVEGEEEEEPEVVIPLSAAFGQPEPAPKPPALEPAPEEDDPASATLAEATPEAADAPTETASAQIASAQAASAVDTSAEPARPSALASATLLPEGSSFWRFGN